MSENDTWDRDDIDANSIETKAVVGDKWEGEDEEDQHIKDNWEDSEDEKTNVLTDIEPQTAYQRPKKKPLAERIAEKEAAKRKAEAENETKDNRKHCKNIICYILYHESALFKANSEHEMTAGETMAEKGRLLKIQEQESFHMARDLMGLPTTSLDSMMPSTEDDFSNFADALISKILYLENSPHFPSFLLKLVNDLCVRAGVDEVRQLSVCINNLYREKDKLKKELEKKKKRKAKTSIRVERGNLDLIDDPCDGYSYDDDDFL